MFGRRCHQELQPIDDCGRPTTYLSYMILKTTLYESNRWFTSGELAKLLAARQAEVDEICRGLMQADLLAEKYTHPREYKYNTHSRNTDVQIGFEKYVVDVEVEALPVHLTLDYSPSHRSSRSW